MFIEKRMLCRFFNTLCISGAMTCSAFLGWYIQPLLQNEVSYDRLKEKYTEPSWNACPNKDIDVKRKVSKKPPSDHLYLTAHQRHFDWKGLSNINGDIIGWIYVPGTPIDYPIVQAPASHPEKYLTTTFEGAVSYPNNQGAIYLDADNIDSGLEGSSPVLYGHYQLNQSMFSAFSRNGNLDSLLSHRQVIIYTPSKMFHVELFAGNYVDADHEKIRTSFRSNEELNAWVQEKLEESEAVYYNPGKIDRIFTFITCSYSLWENQRTLSYGRVLDTMKI